MLRITSARIPLRPEKVALHCEREYDCVFFLFLLFTGFIWFYFGFGLVLLVFLRFPPASQRSQGSQRWIWYPF